MRHKILAASLTVVAIAAFASTSTAAAQQRRPDVALEQAMHVEQVDGDLQRAITLYQRILTDHAADRAVAAKAQLHIGLCYETLGVNEAQRAYQQVIDKFGDQTDVVSQARAHLAALRPPTVATAGGPLARRLLSYLDTDINDFLDMVPSPDGRRMAHIDYWDGGVYVRDLATDRRERVAVGLPDVWYSGPKWSPDGTRLAVGFYHQTTKGAAIRVIDVATREVFDVPGTEATEGTAVQGWSPDGRRLLCVRGEQVEFISVDDGTVTVLVDSTSMGTGALSPDGRFLTYARGDPQSAQLLIKAVPGGEAREIIEVSGGTGGPLWSPDGRAIAYGRGDGIWLVPVANGSADGAPRLVYPTATRAILNGWTQTGGLYFTLMNDVMLPYQVPVDPNMGGPGSGAAEVLPNHPDNIWQFAWSPDMQHVAFAAHRQSTIDIRAADGRVSTYDVAPGANVFNMWWSEDGREVVFVSQQRGLPFATVEIGALDPSTGRVRQVRGSSGRLRVYSMSADGQHLLVIKPEGTEFRPRSFAIADFDLQDVRVLAPAVDAEGAPLSNWVAPQFSPQGDRMLFGRQGSPAALWIVGTDATDARRLATVETIWSAVWDPTGRFIAYTGTVDSATTELRVVNVASGVSQRVPLPNSGVRPFKVPGADFRVVDWSRDGRFLGVVMEEGRWEFWALKGLSAGER